VHNGFLCFGVVTLDLVEHQFDAASQNQAVVADAGATRSLHGAASSVDAGNGIRHPMIYGLLQVVIGEGDVFHLGQASQHAIRGRAGNEIRVRLDDGDFDLGFPHFQVAGTGGAAKTGADNDNLVSLVGRSSCTTGECAKRGCTSDTSRNFQKLAAIKCHGVSPVDDYLIAANQTPS